MNDRLRELMLEAGYAAPEIAKRAQLLAGLVVQDVIGQITVVKSSDEVVAVTLTDEEHRILKVVWQKDSGVKL